MRVEALMSGISAFMKDPERDCLSSLLFRLSCDDTLRNFHPCGNGPHKPHNPLWF